jgi:hypothetical protein
LRLRGGTTRVGPAPQALKEGFGVYLVTDATKPVIEAQGEEALEDLKPLGVRRSAMGDGGWGPPVM